MAIRDLPDMYALSPRAYISGKSLMAMLQVLLMQFLIIIFTVVMLSNTYHTCNISHESILHSTDVTMFE